MVLLPVEGQTGAGQGEAGGVSTKGVARLAIYSASCVSDDLSGL